MKATQTLAIGLTLAVGVGLVASGCAAGGATENTANTTLIASHPQEPASWNYLEDTSSALMVPIYLNVVESLFESNADGSLEPLLAESYTASDDGLSYTVKLREAVFHDGTDFDSADVVYSLEKNATSVSGSISGPLAVMEEAVAVDSRTVEINLSRPSNAFLAGLGTSAGMIAPEDWFEGADAAERLVGTGPFVFGEYRRDVDLTLDRFDDYWGEKPFLTQVTHRFMPDETATINALRVGEIDVVGMLLGEGVDQVASLDTDPAYVVSFTPATQSSFLFLNPRIPELQDERVRQAIAYAIDRKPIVDAAVGGYAETACLYLVPANAPGNSDYCPYLYDPDMSRQLLAEAGYADGLTLDFPYLTIAEFPASFEVINAQLVDVGITVEARGQDLATWLDQVFGAAGNYEISHITNNASIFAMGCEGGLPPLGGADNKLCDPEFEKYVLENDQITDAGEYKAAMGSMVDRFTDMAWVIPLFGKTEPTVASKDISGIAPYRTSLEMDYRNIKRSD